MKVVLNYYGACLFLEVELAGYTSQHTQRVQNSKELALILPSHQKSAEDIQPTGDVSMTLRVRKSKQASPEEIEMKSHIASLHSETEALAKAMAAACKARDPVPLKHKNNLTISGAQLLLHSSWNWHSIPPGSRSREFHNIAGVSVLEWNIIGEYRNSLIQSSSTASTLRSALSSMFKPYMKKRSIAAKRGGTAGISDFLYPDQISIDASFKEESFTVSDALPTWNSYREREEDKNLVQKIVCVIEKTSLAWEDPSNEEKKKNPPLNSGVQKALQALVQVTITCIL